MGCLQSGTRRKWSWTDALPPARRIRAHTMDAHSPTVEPTPPPNLRRVRLKPAGHPGDERADPRQPTNRVPGGLDAGDAPFRAKEADVRVRGVREEHARRSERHPRTVSSLGASRARGWARRPERGGGTRSRGTSASLFFAREEEQTKTRNEARKERRASSEETAAVPSRARRGARWGCDHRSGFTAGSARVAGRAPRLPGVRGKDAAIARLAEQRSRLGGFLRDRDPRRAAGAARDLDRKTPFAARA